MRFSSHNIISSIKDSDNYFIVNPLSGNADILSPSEYSELISIQNGNLSNHAFLEELTAKGYIMDEETESRLWKKNYLDFIDRRETDEVQLFFVPHYACNFACSYCYQHPYENPTEKSSLEVFDAFLNYLTENFAHRRKYITLFGGEPLLTSQLHIKQVSYFLSKCTAQNIDVCIVTNGYSLTHYLPILQKSAIREIQVTLDGTEDVHNTRRFLHNGQDTFSEIVKGIDVCLQNNIPINLRMVIDKENIENLPDIARFAIDKGWTSHALFKTQIGRNYELHQCQSSPDKLFTRVSLYEHLYQLIKKHPHILQFYKPAYSLSKYLSEHNALPSPLFDSCPACKTEWAFDYTGTIYPCTATVGKTNEALGTYYPQVSLRNNMVQPWENRDITTINECMSCNLRLACGGGCASVAKNKMGSVSHPDCRPVKELLEMGFASYF